MHENSLIIAGMISVALVLVAVIYVFGKLKIEQQRTLRKILEKDETALSELPRAFGSLSRADSDFRRGILLIVTGITLGAFFFYIGGKAWIMGFLPLTIGCVYLFFWVRNGAGR